ncbi:MAG: TonB-dependent receptor [Xanthomonadales bacterium]|nr:TonB-dependent receptor [Xanthomonadales bacterium]
MMCALFASMVTVPVYAQEQAKEEEDNRELETLTVTSRKTEENIQDVAVTVQALGGEELEKLNIGNFDDLVTNLPSISSGGRGPGQSTVFIRGLAIQPITVLLSGAQGTSPNVAIYLDEQPVTAPGRNLDVYATDLERIEVLPGPQGTLFGASSQAGTIRYITNKPNLDGFDAGINTSISFTEHGENNQSIEGFLNFPITDNLAARLTFYNVDYGGYIDNVLGEFTLDPAINPESAVDLPEGTTYESASNAALTEENFNDSFYKGFRLGLFYQINDDWSLLVQNSYQDLGADGVFDFDPSVGDLDVQRFFEDELDDEFNQTAWTLEGRLGALDVVYTGSYLDRSVEQSVDYTGYNNAGAFIAYYTCTYYNPDYIVNYGISPDLITPNRQCLNPVKGFVGEQDHTRHTHEFRIATPSDKRLRAVAGVFYDDLKIETLDDFFYLATTELGFAPNAPIAAANNINPNVRPPGVAFFNDITRSEEQIAFFGEVSYDLVPNTLTATVGLRYYDLDSDFTGSSNFANGIFQGSVDSDRGRDYDVSGGHTPEPLNQDDVIPKFNLAYKPWDGTLFYATYSEGFRPGGFNRGGGLASVNPDFPTVETTYQTDDVTNYELGWKTLLFDNSLIFNGSAYYIDWSDIQVSRFDPENVSILTFIENAADAEIYGVEADLSWRATSNLTLFGAFSYNDAELTSVDAQIVEIAPVGSQLPLTPKFQSSFRARFDWSFESDLLDYGFVQAGVKYASTSFSSLVAEDRRRQERYTLADFKVGVTKDSWAVEFFIDNLTNKRAQLFINNQDDIERVTTVRPRTMGFNVSYRFLPY